MRKIFFSLSLLSAFIISGCIKNDPVLVTGTRVEFDAATYNAPNVGVTYPLLLRQPLDGTSGGSGNAIIRTTTKVTFRINLVGAQRSVPTVVNYKAFNVGTAAGTTITYSIAPLVGVPPVPKIVPVADAISGVHYSPLSGTVTIPATSSFGFIEVLIINGGTDINETRILGLEILDGPDYEANDNYSKVAFAISQRVV